MGWIEERNKKNLEKKIAEEKSLAEKKKREAEENEILKKHNDHMSRIFHIFNLHKSFPKVFLDHYKILNSGVNYKPETLFNKLLVSEENIDFNNDTPDIVEYMFFFKKFNFILKKSNDAGNNVESHHNYDSILIGLISHEINKNQYDKLISPNLFIFYLGRILLSDNLLLTEKIKLGDKYLTIYQNSKYYKYFYYRFINETKYLSNNDDAVKTVANEILNEKKKYNKRLKSLFAMNSMVDIEEILSKKINNSNLDLFKKLFLGKIWIKVNHIHGNWSELHDSIIVIFMHLESLSKIETGSRKLEKLTNELEAMHGQLRPNSSPNKTFFPRTSNPNKRFYSKSFDRYMSEGEIKEDHVFIPGVGWMYEDEI